MRIAKIAFSGTAEEFKQVAHMFASEAEGTAEVPVPRGNGETSADATVTFVRHLLTRRRIANGQLAIFKALYEAGDQGLSKARLAAATNRTEKQIHGVMGALGRRINHTGGIDEVHPAGGTGALLECLPIDGEMRYVMRPQLRKVLEDLKIVSPQAAR